MNDCNCGGTRLIYACSGCADVGELADKIARKINKQGKAKMSCLAGIGAGLSAFIESAKGACGNVTIDGCQVACAKKTLERAGMAPQSFVLTEMGFIKGKTQVADALVDDIKEKIAERI